VTAAQELATVLHRTEIVMVIPPKTPIPRIETVALECLKPNPRNARTHSKRQIKLIADSVKTFGFVNPILIDKDGMIIAGHGRLTAAKRLCMTEVPALRIEHLREDEIRAYVLADNQLATLAGWDDDILAIELQSDGGCCRLRCDGDWLRNAGDRSHHREGESAETGGRGSAD
jgi:hypothetical protein